MATENKNWFLTFEAAEDLSSLEYQIVTIADDKIANDGQEATGVLVSKPKSGEHGSIMFMGIGKARAGGAIAKNGVFKTVTSGYISAATSGGWVNGRALEAITSGSIGKIFWHGVNQYQVSSIDG